MPTGNPTTGFSVGIGSGVQTGDILLISITNRDGTGDPSVTDNDSGGNAWAKLGGGATGLTVWWKRATSATASKTVTVGSCVGSSSGVLTAWRGVTTAVTPYENVATESNASGDESHAGFTPARAGSLVCLAIANRTNDIATDTQVATNPSTVTELGEKLSTGGSDCANTFCAAVQTGSSAEATGTISWAQTDAATISCAFNLIPSPEPMTASSGSFSLTGNAAGLTAQRKIAADSGAFSLTGNSAGLARGYRMNADAGSFALSGVDVGLRAARLLVAAAASFALVGNDAGLDVTMPAGSASFALTGHDATLVYTPNSGSTMQADTGSFVLTGNAANLRAQRKIAADAGSFALAGSNAGLTAQRRLACAVGAFSLVGNPATLGVTMPATTASFALSGAVTGLRAQRFMTASVGAFTLVGNDAGLRAQRKIVAVVGAFVLAGGDANLSSGKGMTASSASFVLVGNDAGLRAARRLSANVGSFALVGGGAVLARGVRMSATAGAFVLTGYDVLFSVGAPADPTVPTEIARISLGPPPRSSVGTAQSRSVLTTRISRIEEED